MNEIHEVCRDLAFQTALLESCEWDEKNCSQLIVKISDAVTFLGEHETDLFHYFLAKIPLITSRQIGIIIERLESI